MPSIESLMEMLATMILFILIAMILLQAFAATKGDEVSLGQAYPMTQKIVYMINSISAGPQNESAVLKISAKQYRIDFDEEHNYVECEASLLGNTKYGLFLFEDFELVAEDIDCITEPALCLETKNLLIAKEVFPNGYMRITVSETGPPGPEEVCSDQSAPGRPCGCYSTDICSNVLINGECQPEQYECRPMFECCCCHDEVP